MTFKLRPYQTKALDKIYYDLQKMPEVLLTAIMGSGKTAMSVRLIQRLYNENPGMNFLILMHKKELCQQFYKALQNFTDIPFRKIGICCAGLGNKQVDRQITIASIQTFVNIKESYLGAGLIIIDEAHRVNINGNTEYSQCINYLRLQKPQSRILGLTATPFRLGMGYCFGSKTKKGSVNLFPVCNHKITYEELRDGGHLVPLKGVIAAHESLESDLAGISVNGDYNISELGEIVCREIHLQTCVDAIGKYCPDYDCICVICVDINHAQLLHDLLGPEESTIVHSQLSDIERQSNMLKWENGVVRIMISVQILIEGYDLPRLKAIVMARPTLSASLYLQAVGRVLRTCEGKDHGFLLDITDNTSRLCPSCNLDDIKITVPKEIEKIDEKEKSLIKICPNCTAECHIALRVCSECDFAWPEADFIVAESMPDMKNVVFIKSPPIEFDIIDWAIEEHESKKNGKLLGKITFLYSHTEYKEDKVYMWLCFEDHYQGFAVQKAKEKWSQVSECNFPKSVDEFMNSHFKDLKTITVDLSGKYPELISVGSEVLEYEDEVPF